MTILALLLLLAQQDLPPSERERLQQIEDRIDQQERSAAEIRERTSEQAEALDRLRGQLVSTASALQSAETRATGLEQDLSDIEAREAVALEERDARSLELSQVLGALQNLERSRPPALVVSPDDAQEAALAAISLSSLTPRLSTIVKARKEEIVRLAALREDKRKARADLEETYSALAERRRLLQDLLDDREAIYNRDRAELRKVEQETRRLAAEASSIRDLLNRLRDLPGGDEVLESYRRSRRDLDLPATFGAALGLLESPVAGVVAGQFGERDQDGNRRDALELFTRPGAVVTAPYQGRVQWASEFGALGNVLILDVGGGYSAIMIGVDRFIVRKGQQLSAGEPVGVMSQTTSSPLLRFQVRKDNRPVDPLPWIGSGLR